MKKVDVQLINKLLKVIGKEIENDKEFKDYKLTVINDEENSKSTRVKTIKIYCKNTDRVLMEVNIY